MARTRFVRAIEFARIYSGLDRVDEAFAWLEKAYRERNFDIMFLRVDPTWDPLRKDPRFAALVHRIGIPDSSGAPP